MYKILVCGGRHYMNINKVHDVLNEIADEVQYENIKLIHGCAPGADTTAANWAKNNCVASALYPAQWLIYGPSAGPIRNKLMLDEEKPDLVIAFPGGKGTANMIQQAKLRNIPIKIINDGKESTN